MQKVLSAAEMREVDRLTTERYGIPPLMLMENAAHAAARVICEKLGGSVEGRSVLILCGPGNNGGDGAALGRILWTQGAYVEVVLLGCVENIKGEARLNFEILQKLADQEKFDPDDSDISLEEITSLEEWMEYDSVNFHADDPDIVVDALFGTGVKRPLDGVFEQVAAFIHAYAEDDSEPLTTVVSLDLPSGLCADQAERIGTNPAANVTVTFTAPKAANVLPPALGCNGELYVEQIGSPSSLIKDSPSQLYVAEMCDAASWMGRTEFASASYKNKRGHALIVAGSRNYSGAAVLCGDAAIRSGVGLVTLAVPTDSAESVTARVSPEVMVRAIQATESGSASQAAVPEIDEFLENIDVVAVGSGLSSKEDDTKRFVERIVKERKTPVVLDADALTALSPFELEGSDDLPLILTPHDREFARLLGSDNIVPVDQRVTTLRDFARDHKVFVVLKGERIMVGGPDGRVVVNSTGNSGLGKAGNGDTLTGLLTGFLAQAVQMEVDVFETIVAAVYVAGLAGDIGERKFGKRVMTASDVRDCIADAFELIGSK